MTNCKRCRSWLAREGEAIRKRLVVASLFFLVYLPVICNGQGVDRDSVFAAMKKAASYYHQQVASHGGYVYHYSLDLKQRWGEGLASQNQVWVQPPGTPTVGMAYLRAYEATADREYLAAAADAASALVYGQLKSGGWTNSIDFDPQSPHVADYRNGKGRGKNNSSLDDGQTQTALQFLVEADRAFGFQNESIHQAALVGLDALLAAQFPNGAFPQVWTKPVQLQPIKQASYPDYDWRMEGRVKNYWDMYTLNDNVTGYVAATLIVAHRTYGDDRYRTALSTMGDFLVLAQMPEPQPGWAQQYNYEMQPIWARKFEPPGVSGDETQEVIATLLLISDYLGDRKYLEPIPRAVAWLQRSLLPTGQLARFYELRSNRPLYMERQADKYTLTFDDSNLPDHYGWKTDSQLDELGRQYTLAQAGRALGESTTLRELQQQARAIIGELDEQGRWVNHFDGQRLVGQAKLVLGQAYLSSRTFSDNLSLLSEYASRTNASGGELR